MSKLVRALVSTVAAVGLLVGVPAVLIVVAGWPLPTKLPNWDNVYWAVRQGDVGADAVIKGFACVAWLAWAQIAWALLWELIVNVPRLVRGQPERAAPLSAAPASRLARRLITAAMVLTAISSSPATTVAAPSLSSLAVGGSPPRLPSAPATLMVGASDVARPVAAATVSSWRAMSGDTLWDIAERCLGDGSQVDEILRCNPRLDPTRALRAGQLVQLPVGITVPADRAAAAPAQSPVPVPAPAANDTAASGHRYVVVDDDTLWDIVERHYGVVTVELVDQVAADSGIVDPSLIYTGDVIVLREFATSAATGPTSSAALDVGVTTYRVVESDTLWDILDGHYGQVDAELVWAVAAWNELENPSVVNAGQSIMLPPLERLFPAPPDETVAAPDGPSVPATTVADVWPPPQPASEAPASPPIGDPPPLVVADPPPPVVVSSPPAATQRPQTPAAAVPAPPSSVTPPTPVPATTSSPVTAAVAVDSDDMLSSRWLFGGVTVSSLGLVGAWLTLKQKRRRRRRWLGVEAAAAVIVTTPTERERAAHADVATLQDLVDPALLQTEARAVLLGEQPQIWFRDAAPPPPPGWELTDRGWRQLGAVATSQCRVLSPALVTIGTGTDDVVTEVVLDLVAAGTVSVTGDRVAVERLVCSMLWELASDPLGGAVDLHVVGLACVAARHAANAGRSVSLDEAIGIAHAARPSGTQVFLVDPFAGDSDGGNLRDLVAVCTPGSGRAAVIAGPCEHPVEQISVPSAHRVLWDDLTLAAPQLPETVDMELGRMLDATDVGRREPATAAMMVTPDPEAEALALRSTRTMTTPDWFDRDDAPVGDGGVGDGPEPIGVPPPSGDGPIEGPAVLLSVCGREVAVHGYQVPQASAVLFVLAAAGRDMHSKDLADLTGYAAKSISTVFTANHDLVERDSGTLRLAAHVWTDHAWATSCVSQLAATMQDGSSPATVRWTAAAFDAIRALEQGPYAVLPTGRDRGASPWRWVDDFPADAPARASAETEVAEAALAFSELWLAEASMQPVVRPDQLVGELCRLAATIPYAHVVRQLRESPWVSGAECLLSAAARVAASDDGLLGRVQQTARALAAREQLEASNELADELGL